MPPVWICEDILGEPQAEQHAPQSLIPMEQPLVWQAAVDKAVPLIKVYVVTVHLCQPTEPWGAGAKEVSDWGLPFTWDQWCEAYTKQRKPAHHQASKRGSVFQIVL
jgi:hypothetical protein